MRLLDTGADGFVPAATIGNDYYRHHEDSHALIGDRTGETYRLGDGVRVKLVEAIPTAGALRFEMLSEGKRAGQHRRRPAEGPPLREGPETAAIALTAAALSLRCLLALGEGRGSPGSIGPRIPAYADHWIPGARPGMTSAGQSRNRNA